MVLLKSDEEVDIMGITMRYTAKCDVCIEECLSMEDCSLNKFKESLRESGWVAGKKQTFCPEHRPKIRDPEGQFDRWARGLSESLGIPLSTIRASGQAQKMRRWLGLEYKLQS